VTAPIRVPEHETISAVRPRLYRRGATCDRQVNAEGERLITASGPPEPGRDSCPGHTAGVLNSNSVLASGAAPFFGSVNRSDRYVKAVCRIAQHDPTAR
jgi:hypothetical protein